MKFRVSLFVMVLPILLAGCGERIDGLDETGTAEVAVVDENGLTPWDWVDPFIGTGGEGHTYPGATVPFGMVQLSPDTHIRYYRGSFPWCAGYQYDDESILGFSHTHFSGTGHSDMGDVLVMPTVGELHLQPGSPEDPDSGYRSRFSHDRESAAPGYYSVSLEDYDIDVELTATERCGLHRYTFTSGGEARVILDLVQSIYNYDGKVLWSQLRVENDSLVTGFRQTKGWAPTRRVYFAMEFSRAFDSWGVANEEEIVYRGFGTKEPYLENYPEVSGRKLTAHFDFDTSAGETILVRVGISAVDTRGALQNLRAEIPDWDFETIRARARAKWQRELGRITIEGTPSQKRSFYTAAYHTMLAPVLYMDVDRRYRGLDRDIHVAEDFTNYTIYSLWDTYRATHPLFTITQPKRVGDMVNSMLAHRDQSVHGILPVWSFHGNETWCMIGYHSVSVIADAWLKGLRGFDADRALEAVTASSSYGRYGGLEHYMRYGYVPIDLEKEGASKTLEYAYDDWSISRMAGAMGNTALEARYEKRATSWRKVFDRSTGFARARRSDGSWRAPFDPLFAEYGGDYTEGNAWQYTWYVPQDVGGLVEAMGGEEIFVARLDSLFSIETDMEKFGDVEDIAGLIGQYAHGNEPSQHIAYLYNWAGRPWRTQERIHQVMNGLFDDTPHGICGNEDCGQMSAWYIFSSLGFYPVCPGSNEYVFGSPCVPEATIRLGGGRQFRMIAEGLSTENIYIQSVTLNGRPLDRSCIRHDELVAGGTLVFWMGPEPNRQWAVRPEGRPYSMSDTGRPGVVRAGMSAGLPVLFDSEIVRLFIEADSLRVEGNYFLKCRAGTAGRHALNYPYPDDPRLGGARTESLECRTPGSGWRLMDFEELPDRSGARWWVPADLGPEVEIRTVYRQARPVAYARYIVTTTGSWGRPLRNAKFEIHLPPQARPTGFSFPFEAADCDDGPCYVYEADDFMPEKDIIVEWE